MRVAGNFKYKPVCPHCGGDEVSIADKGDDLCPVICKACQIVIGTVADAKAEGRKLLKDVAKSDAGKRAIKRAVIESFKGD